MAPVSSVLSQACRSLGKAFQAKETARTMSLHQEHTWVKLSGHPGRADSVAGRGECGGLSLRPHAGGREATVRTWVLLWEKRELWHLEWWVACSGSCVENGLAGAGRSRKTSPRRWRLSQGGGGAMEIAGDGILEKST